MINSSVLDLYWGCAHHTYAFLGDLMIPAVALCGNHHTPKGHAYSTTKHWPCRLYSNNVSCVTHDDCDIVLLSLISQGSCDFVLSHECRNKLMRLFVFFVNPSVASGGISCRGNISKQNQGEAFRSNRDENKSSRTRHGKEWFFARTCVATLFTSF